MADSNDPFDEVNQQNDGLLGGAFDNSQMTTTQAPETRTTDANKNLTNGTLDTSGDNVYFTPYKTKTGEDTVAGQMQGLLDKESPYMTSARSHAQQAANARGLLNSSMAGTAGEKAAIDSALPIAKQDAGYFQQQGVNEQQADIGTETRQHQADLQKGLYETQGDISSRLQQEQAQQSSQLSEQEHQQQMAQQQADIDWKKLDLEARTKVEADRLSQEDKNMFDNSVNSIAEDYMNDYMELMLNQNFASQADRLKAIEVLNENTRQRYEAAATIYGYELEWNMPSEMVDEEHSKADYHAGPPDHADDPNWEWTGSEWDYNKPPKPEEREGYKWLWDDKNKEWYYVRADDSVPDGG